MSSKTKDRVGGMSTSHKKALATGRNEARIINAYLEIVEAQRPRRGRRRTPESISRRLSSIEKEIRQASKVQQVYLIQERLLLTSELASHISAEAQKKQEDQFIKVAKSFSIRHGISYQAWREFGVRADVLERAGLKNA